MDILENNRLFLQLGWATKFESQLNCSADRFREVFKKNVSSDESFKGVYFNDKDFKGSIKRQSFSIYKSLKFPDSSMSMYGATGTYNETENKLLLNIIVYTPMATVVLYYIMLLAMSVILTVFLWTTFQQYPWVALIPIILFVGGGLFFYSTFKNGVINLTMQVDGAFDRWTR